MCGDIFSNMVDTQTKQILWSYRIEKKFRLDKDGNTKYPDSRLFLIRDTGAKAKVVELKSDGYLVPHAVSKKNVASLIP